MTRSDIESSIEKLINDYWGNSSYYYQYTSYHSYSGYSQSLCLIDPETEEIVFSLHYLDLKQFEFKFDDCFNDAIYQFSIKIKTLFRKRFKNVLRGTNNNDY